MIGFSMSSGENLLHKHNVSKTKGSDCAVSMEMPSGGEEWLPLF